MESFIIALSFVAFCVAGMAWFALAMWRFFKCLGYFEENEQRLAEKFHCPKWVICSAGWVITMGQHAALVALFVGTAATVAILTGCITLAQVL
jgi:hypothetical protein